MSKKIEYENEVIQTVQKCYELAAQQFQATMNFDLKRYDGEAVDYFETHLPNPSVLELGFGNGTPLGKRFLEKGLDYQGIQLSDLQIKLSHELMPTFKDKFKKGQMVQFCENAKDNSYGGIVSLFAILHLTPAQQLYIFQNIHRILAPNGLFVIATPEEVLPFGYIDNFLNNQKTYQATFPIPWYKMSMQYIGFETVIQQFNEVLFQGGQQKFSILVFKKKQINKK